MIKVVVKNLQDIETHKGIFANMQAADAWIAAQGQKYVWGKPDRWVSEDRLIVENENIANSDQMIIEPIMGRDVKLYHFPATYSVTKTDISAEIAAANAKAVRSKKRVFGEQMVDKIASLNDSKGLTVDQVDAFMNNAVISNLREHLWTGNIDTFVSKLQAADVTSFFTSAEKAAVISECQAFLASL